MADVWACIVGEIAGFSERGATSGEDGAESWEQRHCAQKGAFFGFGFHGKEIYRLCGEIWFSREHGE